MSKTVEKVRELVAFYALASAHVEDVIAVFKDEHWCEDFRLHLKIFEMDKLKGKVIDIELMLTELDSKHTNLLRQKEWSSSTPDSSIDSKHVVALSTEKQTNETNFLLQALLAKFQKRTDRKSRPDWITFTDVPKPKHKEP